MRDRTVQRLLAAFTGALLGMVVAAAVIIVVLFIAVFEADAQMPTRPAQCNSFAEVQKQLKDRWDEEAAVTATTHNGGMLTAFVSPGGATWSIVISAPGGPTCLVAAGANWRGSEIKPAGDSL